VRSPVSLVEVRGWAGTGRRGGHDVLLVIDRSFSAWAPSGADIDGDGEVGRMRPRARTDRLDLHPYWTTDPGDTVFQAEVLAAEKLAERLDPKTTRMGLVTFAGSATVRAPLGSTPEELVQALYKLPMLGKGGTDFVSAIRRSVEEFQRRADPDAPPRHLSLMLLSDGMPAVSRSLDNDRLFARREAEQAGAAGVRIYAFAIGPNAVEWPHIFHDLVGPTNGELVLVREPADVIDFMPYTSLTRLESISIDNLSSSARARSVRLFPDGSFDGYAPLVPGLNILRFTAHGENGSEHVKDVRIHYEKVPADSPARMAEAQRILKELRIRTIETELAARAREKRNKARWMELEIEVEE